MSVEDVLMVIRQVSGGTPFYKGRSQGKCAQDRMKVTVFKYKRRKDYKVKKGHRQSYTELLIEKIILEA